MDCFVASLLAMTSRQLPLDIIGPVRLDLRLELLQRRGRGGAVDEIFSFRKPREHLQIDQGRMMDDVAVIFQVMGYLRGLAKVVQVGIRKLCQSVGGIGGEIVDDLQRRRRKIPHRYPLQNRIGREINVEFYFRMARDQADRIAFKIPDHRVIVVKIRQVTPVRDVREVPERGDRVVFVVEAGTSRTDRKSTRLNSSHQIISYAVFCLKKKKHESCMHVDLSSL